MCFRRKKSELTDKEKFKGAVNHWGKKLEAMEHQLTSCIGFSGDKKEELEEIIKEYNDLVHRLFSLTR